MAGEEAFWPRLAAGGVWTGEVSELGVAVELQGMQPQECRDMAAQLSVLISAVLDAFGAILMAERVEMGDVAKVFGRISWCPGFD